MIHQIALIGFAQSLFFALLIATKKRKEIKDYLLVFFLLLVAAELIYRYLLNIIPESENKWIALFDISYWALFGPVTISYIQSTINKKKKNNAVQLLYLLPLIIGLYAVKDFYFDNVEYNSFLQYYNDSKGINKVALYCWEFCSPIFILTSIIILINHKRSIKYYFSDVKKKDFNWLFLLLSGFILYILFSYAVWLIEDIFKITSTISALGLLPVILTIYVFFIGVYGYKQPGIFFDYPVANTRSKHKHIKNDAEKYLKSGLDEVEREEIKIRLKEVMRCEKPYLEDDLNISELAKRLDTSFHKLSQVINESFHQNFYDFINTYRISETRRLMRLSKTKNFTIISIAYDCGFNSKSSFYGAFKKYTGITPREYMEKIKHKQPN